MPVTCPNCGGPHPRWECKTPRIKVFVPEKSSETSPYKAGDEIKMVVVSNAVEPDLKAGYNAYMREYMRKKRAKDKAK